MQQETIYILIFMAIIFLLTIFLFNKIKNEQSKNFDLIKDEKEKQILELKSELNIQKEQNLKLQNESKDDKTKIAQLQTKLTEQEKNNLEKFQILNENGEKLKQEFQNLANEILDKNSKKFAQQNELNLDNILKPMKFQLEDFKKKVEDVYDKESKDRSVLQNELKTLKELNQKISQDAINLTNALKGQNKTQGSWGEMVLEKVLESSGLRKNEEYLREEALKNDDGKTYRPDVIVNLPNDRQVIIDAKTSLVSYEQYVNESDELEKQKYLTAHLISINKHISDLSDKKYENLKGINTLDFIFMFIPIESALMIALENDRNLFDNAFKKKIVLVSPTTLLVALRAVENSWRYERQAQNTEEVVRLAEKLYGKVKGFVDDFDKVGKHLENAQNSYDEAYQKLSKGKDNIIRQVEVFRTKSNIKPKKELDKELIESSYN